MSATIESRPTARQLGIRIGRLPSGPLGDITDVPGVRVGHATVWSDGPPVARSGVTAVLPHTGSLAARPVPAAVHVLNGYGKSVGLPQVAELGRLETPILLTNTLDVWRCAEALGDHVLAQNPGMTSVNPVVLECNDSRLNAIRDHAVDADAVREALAAAAGGPMGQGAVGQGAVGQGPVGQGPVLQGAVGAGTGMVSFGVKGGIGSASRRVGAGGGVMAAGGPGWTVGALVLANFGLWEQLLVAGVPVGRLLPRPIAPVPPPDRDGSLIMLLATDAPLDAHGLGRLARRAPLGMARTGGVAHHGSGDFVLAFRAGAGSAPETAAPAPEQEDAALAPANAAPAPADAAPAAARRLTADQLNLLFEAAVEATEEAILNALFAAVPVTGAGGLTVPALPAEEVLALLPHWARTERG